MKQISMLLTVFEIIEEGLQEDQEEGIRDMLGNLEELTKTFIIQYFRMIYKF